MFCLPLMASGQPVSFDHLTVENGLSQNSVLSIAQDRLGFMWFGTRYGLNKFDTRSFKVYKNDTRPGGLSSCNFIRALLVDRHQHLWIGSASGLNKYNDNTDRFTAILPGKLANSISSNVILSLFEDHRGRLWVGTNNGLNLLTDTLKNTFKRFIYQSPPNIPFEINAIAEDQAGTLWLGTSGGLISLHYQNGEAILSKHSLVDGMVDRYPDNCVMALVTDATGKLWLGTKKTGLICYDSRAQKVSNFTYNNQDKGSISSNNIRKLLINKDGKIWIGTLHGINIFNPATNSFSLLEHDPDNPHSLGKNSIYDIYKDSQDNIWIGTYYGGVNVVYPATTSFTIYQNSKRHNSISSNIVSAITEDRKGNLWIGTEAEGLNYFDRKNQFFTVFKNNTRNPASISSNLVKAILVGDDDNVWIGTHQGGLNLYHTLTGKFSAYIHNKANVASISSDDITSLLVDNRKRFWVGTNRGLNLFNPANGTFKLATLNASRKPESHLINSLFEDAGHNVWVSTLDGLYRLKNRQAQFDLVYTNPVNSVTESADGSIWIGTYHEGLVHYQPATGHIQHYTLKNGLPGDNVLTIVTDQQRHLWICTDNGLSNYNGKTFKNYNVKDGLPGNEFNYNSFYKDSKGNLFFGSYAGLISFSPGQFSQNETPPPMVFTGLKLFNRTLGISPDSILTKDISIVREVTFRHDQNVITLNFAALNFTKPNKNKYAYKLEGFERDWNYVDIPAATYTNLSPGSYTMLVSGTNNDGVWSTHPAALKLIVLPPLWQTWWAYLLYAIALTAIVFICIRYLITRALLKKEQEIHQLKLDFFTNISHEIRTPLTLISGPLEKILDDHRENHSLKALLQPVKNNADRLMHLITELLDFRKAETGHLKLQVSPGDIVNFVYEIYLAFQNMAISRGIIYHFTREEPNITLYFDKPHLEKVIFNLLSNAFKFTPTGGTITVALLQVKEDIIIRITDNGKGIPQQDQAKVFTSFYQAADNEHGQIGSGIGLALSKSIVELHKGTIMFDSIAATEGTPGCTNFIVKLKTGTGHFTAKQLQSGYFSSEDPVHYLTPPASNDMPLAPVTADNEADRPTLLLVEDNTEVRLFIHNALADRYQLLMAADGAEGLQYATEAIPDLIISDVMMPVMDGFELCRKLKTDDRTSHIPVVLLTARAAHIHQVTGLETGADVYLTKPFSLKILELNIRNLLQARDAMRQKFTQVVSLQPQNIAINTTEQAFITKVLRFIEDNLANPDFGVPMLSSEIGMSQPILYKKIRALTNLSVNDFIKSIRLKKAAQLLEQKQHTIYEIAYQVGFNDRKYFSQEFKKYFGKTPTEYLSATEDNAEN